MVHTAAGEDTALAACTELPAAHSVVLAEHIVLVVEHSMVVAERCMAAADSTAVAVGCNKAVVELETAASTVVAAEWAAPDVGCTAEAADNGLRYC